MVPKGPVSKSDFGKPTIQVDLQKQFWELVHKDPAIQEAWGIFSYGGWSNEGQILFFKTGPEAGFVYEAKPNTSVLVRQKPAVTGAAWMYIEKKCRTLQVQPALDTGALDGLQFEFVHITVDKSGHLPILAHRVFMNNPQLTRDSPHGALVDSVFAWMAEAPGVTEGRGSSAQPQKASP
jgi:hypothetical protein